MHGYCRKIQNPGDELERHLTDLRDELSKFKQYCNLIFSGPYPMKSAKEQATFVLLWIGRQGLETCSSWTWEEAEVQRKYGSDLRDM